MADAKRHFPYLCLHLRLDNVWWVWVFVDAATAVAADVPLCLMTDANIFIDNFRVSRFVSHSQSRFVQLMAKVKCVIAFVSSISMTISCGASRVTNLALNYFSSAASCVNTAFHIIAIRLTQMTQSRSGSLWTHKQEKRKQFFFALKEAV